VVLSRLADAELLVYFGFAPQSFWHPRHGLMLPPAASEWLTPLSYQFLHADLLHLGVNMGFLMAFGTVVERRLGAGRFLALFLVTGALGAFGMLPTFAAAPEPTLVIGASGSISGLFGALVRFAFADRPPPGRLLSPAALAALSFFAINLLIGFTGLSGSDTVRGVAWEVHLGGFIAGWLLFPLFDPWRQATR